MAVTPPTKGYPPLKGKPPLGNPETKYPPLYGSNWESRYPPKHRGGGVEAMKVEGNK